ncbi:S8 family serine peptidase [Flavivirga algicola]|uniref:S8 family serine peptidase n=1 Tax=Flavivirga algicola TaxID=2729136 RepID=A0ABX1S1T1_9FLAO|nr:S8 family serine peptidase [Flavivirga algicola]NMH89834.1 S8 family serine peptidase [Flavivirga algicola]
MKSKNTYQIIILFFLMICCHMVNAQENNDYRIKINAYQFDPLERMPDISKGLKLKEVSFSDSTYQLVQFKHALNRQEIKVLKEEYGLKLEHYIPNYTYLECINKDQLKRINKLSFWRWSGNYEPAYKLSPEIGTLELRTTARKRRSDLLLMAIAFDNANADTVESFLRSKGASNLTVIDERKYKGRLKFTFNFANRNKIAELVEPDFIMRLEEVGETFDDNGNTSGTIQSGTPGTTPFWNVGINGENQIIGILDSGVTDINHCMFSDPSQPVGNNHRKMVGQRGTGISAHATFVAGIAAGDDINNLGTGANRGIAWAARITDERRNSSNILTDLNESHADGAHIHTNSWHDEPNPQYNQVAVDTDNFLYNNEFDFLCGSSGNVGESIGPPGTAKNALCVSATQTDPNENNFGDGNSGPTPEGRRKPEIFAPGCGITSAQSGTACGINNTQYGAVCATSWATPAIAGTAALVRQYYEEGWYPFGTKEPHLGFTPTGALIKATLLNSTLNMTGIAGYPGNQEGWGLVRLNNVLFLPGNARNLQVWDVLNNSGLITGESSSYNLEVSTNGQPLKITLVWTDPPALSGAATPLINNLDLVVTGPDGSGDTITYTGNDFTSGQSTVNGTTTDQVNNVEMVLVNTPQPGNYTIQVQGTQINQDTQGFALVATADMPDPPLPTGSQNTLVVLTELPGTTPSGAPSQPNAQNLINDVNAYISEASYGQTTINPTYESVTLTTPLGSYLSLDSNPLIEMTQDVVAELISSNPDVFDQGTATPNDDIDRIMILLNDQGFTGDWATTGAWPYELPVGLTERLSVSVSSVFNDPEKRLNHAMCHQLGMVDLYNHPGVVFAQPHVDNWDIMGNLNIVQPMAWSKERALWLSTHSPNSIRWIPRPAPGSPFSQTIPLNWLSSTNTSNPRAIAIGLTPGVANIQNENVFYFIEARTTSIGTTDDLIPEDDGVLLYYVNENITQGEGPVRIIDQNLTTNTLDDAAFGTGSIPPPAGTGLDVDVLNATGSEAYRIQINYDPPQTTNDMNIRVGDPHWTSPDIWVDSQVDGFDVENGRTPQDRGNDPVQGEDNRIYFTVTNPGPGDAFDVTVSVRISEPYHTIGGAPDFNRFVNQKFYAKIDAESSITDYVVWRPNDNGDDLHSCIKVEIHEVFNDINNFNNEAQQNVNIQESTTASPYEPVIHQFSVTNPYDYYQLFYFRLEGLPQGWTYNFTENKKRLAAHERYEGSLTVYPPDDAEVCTDHTTYITSWMPKGNTLVQYGGTTLQINLRNRTTLTANTRLTRCRRDANIARGNDTQFSSISYAQAQRPKCFQLVTQGCTDPIRANEEIILRYEDPDGNPVYRVVMTDEFGCYSDTYVVTDGGEWKVSATYEGDDCNGSTTTGRQPVAVPIPTRPGGTTGIFGRNWWFSTHVGSTYPLGTLDDDTDANIYAAVDLSTPINDNFNLSFILGIAQMTSEVSSALEHPRYHHFSSNIEWNIGASSGMRPYARFGPGYYRDKDNNNFFGMNFGIGGKSRINDKLIITPGLDYHYVGIGEDNNASFLTFHLGIIFK